MKTEILNQVLQQLHFLNAFEIILGLFTFVLVFLFIYIILKINKFIKNIKTSFNINSEEDLMKILKKFSQSEIFFSPQINNSNNKKHLDEAEKAKIFLDKIIKDKFEYYMITEILPIYKVGKTLDKGQVNELKEKFFIDVSYFINKDMKKILKSYYNTEAIKIYIIEKFFIYLNKIDVNYYEDKFTEMNEKEVKALMK